MSDVERLAKAMYESYGFVRPWEHSTTQRVHGEHTRRAVRAVLTELREPSDAMYDAAETATGFRTTVGEGMAAMIDHILSQ